MKLNLLFKSPRDANAITTIQIPHIDLDTVVGDRKDKTKRPRRLLGLLPLSSRYRSASGQAAASCRDRTRESVICHVSRCIVSITNNIRLVWVVGPLQCVTTRIGSTFVVEFPDPDETVEQLNYPRVCHVDLVRIAQFFHDFPRTESLHMRSHNAQDLFAVIRHPHQHDFSFLWRRHCQTGVRTLAFPLSRTAFRITP